jgi:hypothetical protein
VRVLLGGQVEPDLSLADLARELKPSKLIGDDGCEIGIERMPLSALEKWIADDRLRDGRAITGLFLARAFLSTHG